MEYQRLYMIARLFRILGFVAVALMLLSILTDQTTTANIFLFESRPDFRLLSILQRLVTIGSVALGLFTASELLLLLVDVISRRFIEPDDLIHPDDK